MYYWYGWDEPEALYCVTSPTETGFDFNEAVNIKIEGEAVITEEGDDEGAYTFNAYYQQDGENVHMLGEGLDLKGTYDGKTLKLSEK